MDADYLLGVQNSSAIMTTIDALRTDMHLGSPILGINIKKKTGYN